MARLWLFGAVLAALALDAEGESVFRELSSASGDEAVGAQEEKENSTTQPSADSDDSFPSTTIIAIAVGFVILTGLVFLLVVLRRGRNKPSESDTYCNHQHPENSRMCMKRTTFAVPEATRTGLDEIDSSGSVVPVLGDDVSQQKIGERFQPELKPSWAEASAATSSYSVAPLSSRHTRPAAPMMIYAPARGRGLSHAASDYSSHTYDYSIGMLEAPVSTEYSFDSEGDDVFPSDEVDSYRSMDYTFLSTTSSDVFGSNRSNRDRKGGAWKQVYGPNESPPIGSGLSPQSSGVLFVRQIDPHSMRRMRLDTRVHGARRNKQLRLDVEV